MKGAKVSRLVVQFFSFLVNWPKNYKVTLLLHPKVLYYPNYPKVLYYPYYILPKGIIGVIVFRFWFSEKFEPPQSPVEASQKLKFCMKDFFSKCDQIRGKLRIWSHSLNKSLMGNFCALKPQPLICEKFCSSGAPTFDCFFIVYCYSWTR